MTSIQIEESDITGIGVIDDQHTEILELVGGLAKIAHCGDRERICKSINRIVTHTLAHFEFEEELMEQAGYPYINVHKRLHDHFIERLAGFTQRFDAGEQNVIELSQFLGGWLRSHFAHEDRDYSPQVLMEMHGLTDKEQLNNKGSWFSRTLRRIA